MRNKGDHQQETIEARCARAGRISTALHTAYPKVQTALHFRNPFELLIATILSAQCTDEKVNQVTPILFGRFPDAKALAGADLVEIETIVHATVFFHQKARSIQQCAQALSINHKGQIPEPMEELTALPGVGRKTANLVRAYAMGMPGIIVDTHFKRVIGRLGLTRQTDPDKIESEMTQILPEREWTHFSNALIWHGRKICPARAPQCPKCPLLQDCLYGQESIKA